MRRPSSSTSTFVDRDDASSSDGQLSWAVSYPNRILSDIVDTGRWTFIKAFHSFDELGTDWLNQRSFVTKLRKFSRLACCLTNSVKSITDVLNRVV